MILGQEGAGTIAATSGSTLGLREGDRVVWSKQGGYAEYTAVAADRVVKLPDGLAEDQAVGGFLMGMTALSLIKEAYPVKKGEKVLVHAAAGGVGLLMCQLLKQAGAYTIGTAGSAEKCKLAEAHGADATIDYNANKNWPDKVKELTDGKGVDVVYDSVGATTWEGSLEAVKRKGKGMSCVLVPVSYRQIPQFFLPPSTLKVLPSAANTRELKLSTSATRPGPCHHCRSSAWRPRTSR